MFQDSISSMAKTLEIYKPLAEARSTNSSSFDRGRRTDETQPTTVAQISLSEMKISRFEGASVKFPKVQD